MPAGGYAKRLIVMGHQRTWSQCLRTLCHIAYSAGFKGIKEHNIPSFRLYRACNLFFSNVNSIVFLVFLSIHVSSLFLARRKDVFRRMSYMSGVAVIISRSVANSGKTKRNVQSQHAKSFSQFPERCFYC